MDYVKAGYSEYGADVMLPLSQGFLEHCTLRSQFPGAIGLKYKEDSVWKAVSSTNHSFSPPRGGWGDRKYTVVCESIGQARNILGAGLASNVSQMFSSRVNVNSGNYKQAIPTVPNPPVIPKFEPDASNMQAKKRYNGCLGNRKKKKATVLERSIRVVLIKDVDMPSTLHGTLVLGEGIVTLGQNDSEIVVRRKCIELLHTVFTCNSIGSEQLLASELENIIPSDLRFISCCHRKLTYPIVPPTFEYNLSGIKAVCGQGKLYIKVPVKGKEDSEDTMETSMEEFADLQESRHEEHKEIESPTDLHESRHEDHEEMNEKHEEIESPTINFHPRHNRCYNRLRLRNATGTESGNTFHNSPHRSYVEIINDVEVPVVNLDSSGEEESHKSDKDKDKTLPTNSREEKTLFDLLKEIANQLNNDSFHSTKVNVTRANPLDGLKRSIHRASFKASTKISVRFADDFGASEGAVDEGGPTRELFRLALRQIAELQVFSGSAATEKMLVLNAQALKDGLYNDIGVIFSLTIVHGCQFPNFLSNTCYNMIISDDVNCTVEDIQDIDLRDKIVQLQKTSSLDEIRKIMDENETLFEVGGCYRHIKNITDKHDLVKDLTTFLVLGRNMPAIQQLRQGLTTFGILEAIQRNPVQFQEVFCRQLSAKLTAEQMEAIFTRMDLSISGSNKRKEEERVLTYWRDYLVDIEDGNAGITFEDLLVFATGTDQVPYFGFSPDPSIEFIHDAVHGGKRFSQANTCAMLLRLPVVASYEEFISNMDFSVLNSPGFGMA